MTFDVESTQRFSSLKAHQFFTLLNHFFIFRGPSQMKQYSAVITKDLKIIVECTRWKIPKYGVISGPCSVRIQKNTDQE